MKKYIGILFSAFALFSLSSCEDYFDTVPNDAITLDDVFTNRGLTLQWLSNIYFSIPDNTDMRYYESTEGGWTCASLEGYLPWSHCESTTLINGTLNSSFGQVERHWTEFFRAIQKVNIYLANVDRCEPMPLNEKEWTKAEARALRAYYYFCLVREFGPVPLIGDRIFNIDDPLDDMKLERASLDECFDYIISELDDVISSGKLCSQLNNDGSFNAMYNGNLTVEAAEGIRHIVYLFRASYLFNGDPYYKNLANKDGKKLFPQEEDLKKWEDVKRTALDIINSGKFKLVLRNTSDKIVDDVKQADPYYSLYRSALGATTNEEMIFYRRNNNWGMDYTMVPHLQHQSVNGGGALTIPLQFIDLYFTNKGLDITKDEDYYVVDNYGYDYRDPAQNNPCELAARTFTDNKKYQDKFSSYTYFTPGSNNRIMKQFYNREPRFYVGVTFQNRQWDFYKDASLYVELNHDGNCGADKSGHDYPIFGTITRKLYTTDRGTYGFDIKIRLTEVYLNLAEAYANLGQTKEALETLNIIRARAGVAGYATTAGDATLDARGQDPIQLEAYDRETIMKVVYRERLLELAFEQKHYFDVRRWAVADGKWRGGAQMTDGWIYPAYHIGGEGGDMIGFNVNNKGTDEEMTNGMNFYKRVVQQTRIFEKKHSFFPLPQEDLDRDKNLVQNPGWAE